ncbi:MAG: hypothetical protein LBF80_01460, partial [Spirochaetaceae bacterium]|nr:hypothetical protein [Spirochaetaceae bacterium]
MKRKGGFDIQIILFAALVLTTALLKPLSVALLTRMEALRDTGIEKLETALGKTVSYDSMSPSIFGAVQLNGVRLHGGGDIFKNISVKRLRVRYSFTALFTGRPLDAVRELKIEDPLVEIGLDRDFDTLFSGEGGGIKILLERIKNIAGMIPKHLVVRISGGIFRFTAGESVVEAGGIALTAYTLNDTLRFRLSTSAKARLARPWKFNAGFSSRIRGVYNVKTGESGIRLGFDSVETSYFTLAKLNFLLSLSGDTAALQKVGDMEPFDLRVSYDLTARNFDMKARFAGFQPSRLLRFSSGLNSWNVWLKARLYGDVNASFDTTSGLAYRAALRGGLDASTPIGSGSFEVEAAGGAKSAFFQKLALSLPRGELVWTGGVNFTPLFPNGSLVVRDFNLTKSGLKERGCPLNGVFFVSSYGNTITFFAETLSIGATDRTSNRTTDRTSNEADSVELQAFDITLTHTNGEFDFFVSAFHIRNASLYDEALFSSISADGSFNLNDKNLEVRLAPESFSLYALAKMAGVAIEFPELPAQAKTFLDNILVTSEIFVYTDFKDISYNVPHLIAGWQGDSNVWASFSISGTENSFELSESRVVVNGGGVGIEARGDFADKNDMMFNAELRTGDSAYTFNAIVLDKRDLSISSSLGLSINVNLASSGAFSGLLFINAPRFPLGGGFAQVKAEADFRYVSPALWDFNLENFKLSSVRSLLSSNTSIELIGRINQDSAEFSRIYFDDGRGALYGNASGKWSGLFNGEETSITGNMQLRDIAGVETLDAELRYAEDYVHVWAELAELQSGRFFSGADNMFIKGSIGFYKTAENWSVPFDLSSLRGTFNGRPITLSGRGSLDAERLDILETRVSYDGVFADIPHLSVNLEQCSLSSSARLWGLAFDREFSTDLTVNVAFAEIDSWLNIKDTLGSFNGIMNFEGARFSDIQSDENFDFKFSRSGQIWNVTGGPDDMVRLHINRGGDFFAAFSHPSPVLGTIVGVIKDGRIDAETSGLYIDVSSFWRYLP